MPVSEQAEQAEQPELLFFPPSLETAFAPDVHLGFRDPLAPSPTCRATGGEKGPPCHPPQVEADLPVNKGNGGGIAEGLDKAPLPATISSAAGSEEGARPRARPRARENG